MNNLNELIKFSGLKKQKIARYINVADSTLTRYTNNQTYPNIDKLNKLVEILNSTLKVKISVGDITFDEIHKDNQF